MRLEMHGDDFLCAMADYRDMSPTKKQPFVRTSVVGEKKKTCFISGKKSRVTRHHIRKGKNPLVVYLQWKYHQIIHGVALNRFSTADIRTTYAVAEMYSLWKESEANIVRKKIIMELDRRKAEDNMWGFFNSLGFT